MTNTKIYDIEINLPQERVEKLQQGWEKERIITMLNCIEFDDIVLDIGAELGDITALLASKADYIYIIEPAPWMWKSIYKIFKANNLGYKVLKCFPGFASNVTNLDIPYSDDLDFTKDIPNYNKSVKDKGFRELKNESDVTPQIRIDNFPFDALPTMFTIDTEGAELEVLKGAEKFLREHHPKVFVSIHPRFITQFGYDEHELFEHMTSCGYKFELLAVDHEWHVLFY